jgi:hypothetical protein
MKPYHARRAQRNESKRALAAKICCTLAGLLLTSSWCEKAVRYPPSRRLLSFKPKNFVATTAKPLVVNRQSHHL